MFEKLIVGDKPYFEGKPTKAYTQYRAMVVRCYSKPKRQDYTGNSLTPQLVELPTMVKLGQRTAGFLKP